MKTPRLINYLKRYWILLVLWLASSAAVWTNVTFLMLGTVLYVPFLALAAFLIALLIRNVFNTDTTDADSDSGRFAREWNEISVERRVTLTVVQILVYFLGTCLIAASIGIGRPS